MRKWVPLTDEDMEIICRTGSQQPHPRRFFKAWRKVTEAEKTRALHEMDAASNTVKGTFRPSLRVRYRIREMHANSFQLFSHAIY